MSKLYQVLKKNNFPEENVFKLIFKILLFIPDNYACNPRNN